MPEDPKQSDIILYTTGDERLANGTLPLRNGSTQRRKDAKSQRSSGGPGRCFVEPGSLRLRVFALET